jgi:hypothetical protein
MTTARTADERRVFPYKRENRGPWRINISISVNEVEIRDLIPSGTQLMKLDVNTPPAAGWQQPSDTRLRWIHIPVNDTEVVTVGYSVHQSIAFRMRAVTNSRWVLAMGQVSSR